MGSYLNFGRFGGGSGSIAAMETVSGSTAGTTITLTFSGLTDATQCVPFISCRGSGADNGEETSGEAMFVANVFDDGGVVKCTLTRGVDPGDMSYDFNVTLLELAPHITVTKTTIGSGTATTGVGDELFYRDVTVPALVVANSFAVAYLKCASTSNSNYGSSTNSVARLTSTTNARIYSFPAISTDGFVYTAYDPTGEMEVTHVYSNEASSSAWTTKDLTFSAVNPSEQFLIGGYRGRSNSNFQNRRFSAYAEFLNTTTVRYYRVEGFTGGGNPSQFVVQLVKFAGASVQHGAHAWAANDQSENKTITAVDTAKSAALSTLPAHIYNASDSNVYVAGGMEFCMNRVTLTNATTVTLARGQDSGVLAGGVGYQVLTIE